MATTPTISKNPTLAASQDYLFLRRAGIEQIEQLAHAVWTDYNSHDPGITMHEALCYAITDLGFRLGWDIKDLLADPPVPQGTVVESHQAFFTARNILTVNPLTVNDYRRSLIDLDAVKNAWLICKDCPCEVQLYADTERDTLVYAQPVKQEKKILVSARGMYDVLLELDRDPLLGDLNDHKIEFRFTLPDQDGQPQIVVAELRFDEWDVAKWGPLQRYLDGQGNFAPNSILSITMQATLSDDGDDTGLPLSERQRRWQQWQRVFYASFEIAFVDAALPVIALKAVPFRLFGSKAARNAFDVATHLNAVPTADLITGIGVPFFSKLAAIQRALNAAKDHLGQHRNLCEDFCCVTQVGVDDIAVCADIEVKPDADIERVLANVLFEIEQYFNPSIKFYALRELMAEGMPVDVIFNGPPLHYGFIKEVDLDAAQLKTQLRTSDIINRITEIDGIVAIRSLLLTRYDRRGAAVQGAADDRPDSVSASWTLKIAERHQPRLYVRDSRFIFYKNGLPFQARPDEVQDTLNQLRGRDERLKTRELRDDELDLLVPTGTYRTATNYVPAHYALPMTYGVGPEGLREPASPQRRAQAKQLKGYFMFFEQLLANEMAQLAQARQLFSLDPVQQHTYFYRDLRDESVIRGVSELLSSQLDEAHMLQLLESTAKRLNRRNRFLDHVLARFAESFADYALMFHALDDVLNPLTAEALIQRKIAFLKDYPRISRDRAKSLDYRGERDDKNHAVLRDRIALLLGLSEDMKKDILVVEHLLLRPKFPGDAVMQICTDPSCAECGSADPYSAQLTIVMAGKTPPFDTQIELRRFADRTIQAELPSHLLGKVCWVSNLDYGEGWEKNLLTPLAKLLRERGRTVDAVSPSAQSSMQGAEQIRKAAQAAFVKWIEAGVDKTLTEAQIAQGLDLEFRDKLALTALYGEVVNYADFEADLFDLLSRHFARIAIDDRWFRYKRFREAWEAWLTANTPFDWCAERVQQKLAAAIDPRKTAERRNQLACDLAEQFGVVFAQEMKANVLAGKAFDTDDNRRAEVTRIFALAFPDGVAARFGVSDATLRALFVSIYANYIDVSTKLWAVVLQLAQLQSIYPSATLHDCDDGNDDNPVRLGSTMLGG